MLTIIQWMARQPEVHGRHKLDWMGYLMNLWEKLRGRVEGKCDQNTWYEIIKELTKDFFKKLAIYNKFY